MALSTKMSVPLASLTVAKMSIGAGILWVPSYVADFGLVGGILAICTASVVTYFTAKWTGQIARKHDTTDYIGAFSMHFGLKGTAKGLFEAFVIVLALSMSIASLVTYLTVIGNAVESVTGWNAKTGYLVVGIFVLLPLSCTQRIKQMGFISVAALLAMSYVIGVVLFDACTSKMSKDVVLFPLGLRGISLESTSGLLFAMASQFWICPLAHGLATDAAFEEAVLWGTLLAMLVYTVLGVAGYLRFGPPIKGLRVTDAHAKLSGLGAKDGRREHALQTLSLIGQIAVALVYTLSFPLKLVPVRVALEKKILGASDENKQEPGLSTDEKEEDSSRTMSRNGSVIMSTILVLLILALAYFGISSALNLFHFVGAFAAVPLCLIVPGAAMVRKHRLGALSIVLLGSLIVVARAWRAIF